MKNLITYLKTLWRAWGNLQSSDVSLDRRSTVVRPSGLEDKLQLNTFVRFAVVLTLIFSIGVGNAWGADETVTWSVSTSNANTISKDSGTLPTGASASMSSNDSQTDKSQLTSGKKQTFTLTGMDGCTIKGVTINMRKSSKGSSATVTVKVGSTTLQSGQSITLSTTAGDKTVTLANTTTVVGTSENVVITVTAAKSSAYVLKYKVTYEAGGGGTPTCATPTFSPAAGSYIGTQSVTISSTTTGSTIYYTTDGSTPTTGSAYGTAGDASATVSVSSSMTLKAIAVKAGADNSTVGTATYSIVSCSGDEFSWNLTTNSYTTGTDEVTWSHTYATMHNAGTNATNYLGGDANNRTSSRFYNGNTLTITPATGVTISHVVFTATTDGYAGVLRNSTWSNATASGSETYVIVTPTDGTSAFSATVGATCGFTNVNVCYTAAACAADPTKGSAALKGGFSLSSVGVTATGWAAGTNCAWEDYGFVWGTSANPTVSDNKVPVGNSGTTATWDGTLTGSFTTGITYHFRAYGKNGKDGGAVQYSDDATFTPRQVSFNMHGHGGDAPASQVVNNGGKATDPGDPSEAGWTFGGWYNNDSYTGSAWVFGTNTVSGGNVTLHAKWTEKPKYTVTLNAGNGTIGTAGWTNTSGSVYTKTQDNGDASITLPTPTCNCSGWVFQGWSTTSKSNAASLTPDKADGASFVPANDVTYYAVYRQSSAGGTTYSKITSAGDLTTGNYVITGMYNGTTPYKMDGSLYNEGVSLGESSASVTDGSLTESTASYVWTIIKFGSSVVFRNTSTSKFLAIVDGKFALQDEGQLFTYSVTSGAWTFTSPSGKQIIYATRYNVGDSQNREIHLYKQGSTPSGNFYTNPTCSDLSITGVANPAAGGSVTLSATSAKSGEKVYAYYTEDPAYRFSNWSVSGEGASISSTTAKFTEITVGSADVTLTANFDARVMYSVAWKANGEELTGVDLGSASTSVETGEKITNLPPNPSSCDGTSTAFVGWIAESEIWGGKTDDVSAKHIYTAASEIPAVTGAVTYHAVWAKKTGGSGNETLTCSAGTVVSNTMTFSTTNYTIIHKKNDSGATMAAYSPWRVYEKNTVEISGSMTITGLDIVHSGTYYGVLQSNKGTLTLANSSGGTTTVRGIDATEVIITNKSGAAQSQWTSIKIYYDNSTYSQYLVKCCNTPTLTFAASPYAVLREDIQGASTTTWAEVDVTFTSNNTTGTISVPDYGSSKSVYKLSAWESRATTGGTLCTTDHAYLEVLDQPDGETPGTGKFHVKTTSGQTGQGTYRIAITQEATDESHGNFCETTVYGFVDVTLRDKFVDNVNGNGTINRNGHGAQLATPTLSEFGTQEEDACHSEGRKLKGWIKETDLKAQYETGNSTRVQTVDGLCETCANGTDQTSLIVAPGTNVTMSGATWYAVWAYEK